MTSFDLTRIHRETSLRHVEYHDSVASTNQLANELLPDLQSLCPALVLAATQTAGRGRGTNSWWSSTGALTFSLVIDPAELLLTSERLPLTSLAVGVAVRRVLAVMVPSGVISVKWPNDILLNEHKVCGILTEQQAVNRRPLVIIGVGINANNALDGAPDDVRQRATSLFDVTGDSVDLTVLLITVVKEIEIAVAELSAASDTLLAELNRHSLLNGRVVTVQTGNDRRRGVCRGINESGELLLQTDGGLESLISGTVMEW
ncbi:MAG: biotin--[acetyl-CoA-carboxylase] ligase [Planctomycetaceae bacterium]